MFYTIKKKTILCAFAVLLAISALLICFAVKEAKEDIRPSVPALATGISGKNILIDAGHGGFDAGASANGLIEKDVNLSVARKLKNFIEEGGASVSMTREDDVSTAKDLASGRFAKKSDLIRRREMIAESNADAFISIHMNKFPQPEYWGAQVFYAENSSDSQKLGELIQTAIAGTLNDGNKRNAKMSDGNIFILKNAAVPSVIVECGFLSNAKDAEKLKSNDYQSKLAWAIYMGIADYFKETGQR